MTDLSASQTHQPASTWSNGADVADYFALLKPRVMSLVIFTALVGMMAAPGSLHPVIGFTALLCIAVGAGAAGALNMGYEADIDRLMTRTMRRPVAAGRVQPNEAIAFGATLSAFSVILLGLLVNWVAGALLAFTIFFYAVVYTVWLKRSTPQNIVIGGAAGAFPPMIGWAATTGTVSLDSVLLFMLIFIWTPPHFWALALYKSADYARAGVPMLPVVAGERETRRQILFYTLVLVPVGLGPVFTGLGGMLYGAIAAVTGAIMLALAIQVRREAEGTHEAAKRLFAFSVLYLFLLFAALLAEHAFGLYRALPALRVVGG